MSIGIDNALKRLCSGAALGVLHYKAMVAPSSQAQRMEFDRKLAQLQGDTLLENVAKDPHIAATREAYKALGKNPKEYRNAAEAMLRRIIKGKGLYYINNVVEVNNLISVSSGYSIGSYDISDLHGDIMLRRADEGLHYEGIGKGSVNIGCLPVLFDDDGAFGNPTSDSRRAMIQEGRREIYSIFYAFDGPVGLGPWMEKFCQLLERFCDVHGVERWTV